MLADDEFVAMIERDAVRTAASPRMTREQRDLLRKQIDTLIRELLEGEPTRRGRHKGDALKRPTKVTPRL